MGDMVSPSVLEGGTGSPMEEHCNARPLRPVFGVFFSEKCFFFNGPVVNDDVRTEVVLVAIATLSTRLAGDLFRDFIPVLRTIAGYQVTELRVFTRSEHLAASHTQRDKYAFYSGNKSTVSHNLRCGL